MRFVVGSIIVHVLALVVLLHAPRHASEPRSAASVVAQNDQVVETELLVEVVDVGAPGPPSARGGSSGPARRSAISTARSDDDAWEHVQISEQRVGTESGGHGLGTGRGDGIGGGIGFGAGGGIRTAEHVPEPPHVVTPPPSRARPARLIYPVRDREVDDEGNLFIARVTVDTDGDVVGARMLKTRPGVTGDQASSAIWTFRYLPALDDTGLPVRSTFEQPFQIR